MTSKHPGTGGLPLGAAAIGAVLARPSLWGTAVGVALRTATPGWWRSWPPRPLPPQAYLRFRQQTQRGGDGTERLDAEDLVSYLEWCRANRRALG